MVHWASDIAGGPVRREADEVWELHDPNADRCHWRLCPSFNGIRRFVKNALYSLLGLFFQELHV